MNELFFELIRVAVGTADKLSRAPSLQEWKVLYDMTKKQSLVGVCFAVVQKLVDSEKEDFCGMSELQYLTWMGMAAKIQQKNQAVDEQCCAIQKRLAADGFRSCILKGQGVGRLYSDNLLGLRQSGDIDIWLGADTDVILKYVQNDTPTDEINELHAHFNVFDDTEVEIHFTPSKLTNRIVNKKLQRWFAKEQNVQFANKINLSNGESISVPTTEFNLVYQLLHIYRHLFGEGIGLRQLMDYYFLVKHEMEVEKGSKVKKVREVVSELRMNRFASALMWVLGYVFGLPKDQMIWEPNEKIGRFILNEIMLMGNFGHDDDRYRLSSDDSHLKRFIQMTKNKFRFVKYFPSEVFWQPIDTFFRFFEIRSIRRKAARMK